MEHISVFIGIPTNGSLKASTVICLDVLRTTCMYPTALKIGTGGYLHDGRTTLVNTARTNKFSHILFIDSDIAFPVGSLERLLEQNRPIIGGIYKTRNQKVRKQAAAFIREKKIQWLITGHIPEVPFTCDLLGFGLILIEMSVFDKLEKPWFGFETFRGYSIGEDFFFCRRAREAGFEVWCDPTIPVKHIGEYAY